mmetsp:Transcript_15738/g.32255  ORF Transcript_15738/g.32255 Transcript_15738/m.32255 type:complete len:312 (-) Transcript_15738:44-979(-)
MTSSATPNNNSMSSKPIHFDEISARISAMKMQEESTAYRCSDYFSAGKTSVDASCRSKLVEWTYSIVDFCGFQQETALTAFSYVDRYISSGSEHTRKALDDRRLYQLLFMTALHIAVKIHETKQIDALVLSRLSHGKYSAGEFLEKERDLLNGLDWRLSGPTPMEFARCFLSIVPHCGGDDASKSLLLTYVQQQIKKATAKSDLLSQKPSTIALSALLNAMSEIDGKDLPQQQHLSVISSIEALAEMDSHSSEVQLVRKQLRGSFSGCCAVPISSTNICQNETVDFEKQSSSASPVCVSRVSFSERLSKTC